MKKLILLVLLPLAVWGQGTLPLNRPFLQTHGNGNQKMWTNLAGVVFADGTIQTTASAGGGLATNVYLSTLGSQGLILGTNGSTFLYTFSLDPYLTNAIAGVSNRYVGSFTGNGAGLTNLTTTASNSYNGTFTGNGANLTNVLAGQFASGNLVGWDTNYPSLYTNVSTSIVAPSISRLNATNWALFYSAYGSPVLTGRIYAAYGTLSNGFHGNQLILDVGAAGTWDAGHLGGARVYQEAGVYYMFYYAGTNGGSFEPPPEQIGVATSTDGTNFTKFQGNPILTNGPTQSDSRTLYTASLVKHGGVYHMFYNASRTNDNVETMHLATAPHPLGPWRKQGVVYDHYNGSASAGYATSDASVIPIGDNRWAMFYWFTTSSNLLTAVATSTNLWNWQFVAAITNSSGSYIPGAGPWAFIDEWGELRLLFQDTLLNIRQAKSLNTIPFRVGVASLGRADIQRADIEQLTVKNITLGEVGGVTTFRPSSSAGIAAPVLKLQNNSSIGYSTVDLYDNTSTHVGGFGYGNASAANTTFAGYDYIYTAGKQFTISHNGADRVLTMNTSGQFSFASNIIAGAGVNVIDIQNTSASGYSSIDFFNNSGVFAGGIGQGNASAANTATRSHMYLISDVLPMYFSTDTSTRQMILSTEGQLSFKASLDQWVPTASPDQIPTNTHPWVNVREFGANGIFGNDYTLAFSNSVHAATNRGLWKIYIPEGDYTVTNTTFLPVSGSTALTNQFEVIGANRYTVKIYATSSVMTNRDVFAMRVPTGGQMGRVKFSGMTIYGPAHSWGYTNFPNIESVPLVSACINLGLNEAYPPVGSGNRLQAQEITIDDVQCYGHGYGLAISNGQNVVVSNSEFEQNARANVVLAHVDTVKFTGCHGGYVLMTNESQLNKSFQILGTAGSTWVSDAADSGVHKIFENIEHVGPFMYADGARFTVIGGQFEGNSIYSSGWCMFTNKGHYKFIGSTINLTPDTNTFLFSLYQNASAGLSLEGCNFGAFDPLAANPRVYLFDIVRGSGTDQVNTNIYLPYWDAPPHGADSVSGIDTIFSDLQARPNARLRLGSTTNYVHIKQRRADTLGVAAFRENGRRFTYLNTRNGNDANLRPLTNQPYADGPFLAFMQPYFNDPNDLFYAYGVCYDTPLTSLKPWYFPPLLVTSNVDGTMPRNFRISVPIICTNAFTNSFVYDLYCLKQGGSQQKNASGSWGYYSATNVQYYVATLTLDAEPTSPVGIRWGVNAGAWALTNRFFFFDPKIEYW